MKFRQLANDFNAAELFANDTIFCSNIHKDSFTYYSCSDESTAEVQSIDSFNEQNIINNEIRDHGISSSEVVDPSSIQVTDQSYAITQENDEDAFRRIIRKGHEKSWTDIDWYQLWKLLRNSNSFMEASARLDLLKDLGLSYSEWLRRNMQLWLRASFTWELTFGYEASSLQENIFSTMKRLLEGETILIHQVTIFYIAKKYIQICMFTNLNSYQHFYAPHLTIEK
jgi:hypothetical protein